jgi:hypothetical protein
MIIIILNFVFILLLWSYKHFVDKNRLNDNKGNNRKYGWKEYSVFLGLIILFNSYAFLSQDDWGLYPAIIGYVFCGIGLYSNAFEY